jgi:hypothetical protein
MSDTKWCERCGEGTLPENCGHISCTKCGEIPHNCAGCDELYCDCTEKDWGLGEGGVTYCSRESSKSFSGRPLIRKIHQRKHGRQCATAASRLTSRRREQPNHAARACRWGARGVHRCPQTLPAWKSNRPDRQSDGRARRKRISKCVCLSRSTPQSLSLDVEAFPSSRNWLSSYRYLS